MPPGAGTASAGRKGPGGGVEEVVLTGHRLDDARLPAYPVEDLSPHECSGADDVDPALLDVGQRGAGGARPGEQVVAGRPQLVDREHRTVDGRAVVGGEPE